MKILLTNAESLSVATMIRSFSKMRVNVFACSEHPYAAGFYSRFCQDFGIHPSSGYLPKFGSNILKLPNKEKPFVDSIKSMIDKWDIDILIPNSEDVLIPISKNKEEINAEIPLPRHKIVMRMHDKGLMAKFCKKIKVHAPATYLIESIDDIEKTVQEEKFPLIIKPRKGLSSYGTYFCKNKKELLINYKKLLKFGRKPIIQKYIAGSFYSSTFILNKHSRVSCFFCYKKITEKGKLILGFSKNNRIIEKIGEKILTKMKWIGIASPQFLIDEYGKPFLIEINPRILGGSVELGMASGIDIPYYFYKTMLDKKKQKTSFKEDVLCVYPHQFFSLFKNAGIRTVLSGIFNKKTIINVPFHDPLPLLSLYLKSRLLFKVDEKLKRYKY